MQSLRQAGGDEAIYKFIDSLRTKPGIWLTGSEDYMKANKNKGRERLYAEILYEINLPNLTTTDLRRCYESLRCEFGKRTTKAEESDGDGKWPFLTPLAFLRSSMTKLANLRSRSIDVKRKRRVDEPGEELWFVKQEKKNTEAFVQNLTDKENTLSADDSLDRDRQLCMSMLDAKIRKVCDENVDNFTDDLRVLLKAYSNTDRPMARILRSPTD